MEEFKTMCGTLRHILASGTAVAEQFTLNVQEPVMCYRPNVRKVTPGSHALHHLVTHTFQHTNTQILCVHLQVLVAFRCSGGDSALRTAVCGPRGGLAL